MNMEQREQPGLPSARKRKAGRRSDYEPMEPFNAELNNQTSELFQSYLRALKVDALQSQMDPATFREFTTAELLRLDGELLENLPKLGTGLTDEEETEILTKHRHNQRITLQAFKLHFKALFLEACASRNNFSPDQGDHISPKLRHAKKDLQELFMLDDVYENRLDKLQINQLMAQFGAPNLPNELEPLAQPPVAGQHDDAPGLDQADNQLNIEGGILDIQFFDDGGLPNDNPMLGAGLFDEDGFANDDPILGCGYWPNGY